ncbi:MAG TPA: phenylalanine--tRNA ligase beta subunit-related protein [Solirubrobacteraceae bacterium]|nr:phenylalanine--tRNA ligase beta subunit-related protein [Solirubrobacteraceae bacterium]
MGEADALELRSGSVAADVCEEFPELTLVFAEVAVGSGRTPEEVKLQLRLLSDRFRGAQAIAMRQDAVPQAYRVFYRQVGLDPDAERTPVEATAVKRLLDGAFRSRNLLDDALTIALVETGVPIWAFDADAVDGDLSIRLAAPGERLGRQEQAPPLPSGRMVVADERSPLAVLFGELAPGHGVTDRTRRMVLFSLQVAGVPAIHVEEALWACATVLDAGELRTS